MRFCGLLAALCAVALTAGSAGASEVREFADSTQRERYEQLVRDLRCLVCQNQSLADSDADLARDLRDEVYQIIQSGKSDQEAVAFLVDRYGDFVLYRPPLKPATWLLWSGPCLLLTAGLGFIWHRTRQRARTLPRSLTPEEQARLLELKKRIQE